MERIFFIQLAEKIRPIFGKIAIILHGSRIKGNYYPASDLDILIISENCLDRKGLKILYSFGEELNGIKLDYQLVCYKNKDYWIVKNVLSSPHLVIIDDFNEFMK
ncbi:nucleotidyltransferase domain-containing protein [Sulfurisphaera ohwakuensis]|uniref:Nucleotidyltransferase domain-containing protein n=1 Tax=Sulfurisphaera ohwakuensis TaxID=69656 RepID=A0A650CFF9_SULOH|nr:nucleotidyltransferase domain-containing protein [Sulfurisphaera ohwakuensis]MBB5255086.1 putative nucleotidyltransferase [Sulfurisphaera ohwakuensis]QGR16488.1 nucleotidyltransferase domain-containing protein [Sulfurisphaera ohwakuensis]